MFDPRFPGRAQLSRRCLLGMTTIAALTPLASFAKAEVGKRPGRLVVGFAAGGAGDSLARSLVQELKPLYSAGLIVENKPGASGRIAVDTVKMAEADGNTLLYAPSALLTITPHALKAGTFKPLESLIPIAAVSRQDFAICAFPGLLVNGIADLLTKAKTDPKLTSYATAGAGTPQHLIGHLLAKEAGAPLIHVPYKGGAVAMQDTVAGHTPVCIAAVSQQLVSLVADGRLRVLAVAGRKRSAFLPTAPTLAEAGIQGIEVEDWSGVLVPARTPHDAITKISDRLVEATKDAKYAAALAHTGQEPMSDGSAAYAARLAQEFSRWAAVVKASGFTIDS